MSDSISEFWIIVSFTAKKSSRMLCTSEVSVMLRSSEGQYGGGRKRQKMAVITEDKCLAA
jgi:hypothetical protein